MKIDIYLKKYRYFILIIVICWFILFEITPSINIPEITSVEINFGIQVLNLINNIPSVSNINFWGRHLPTASTKKHGAMEIYLLAPFIFFGGSTLESLRVGAVLWGILILLLTYYFCVSFFNPAVGLLSLILLATSYPFLSIVKLGAVFGFSIPIFTLSTLLFFLKWSKTKKSLYYYLSAFILGLGFNTMGWFIWFIIAFTISVFFYMHLSHDKIRFKTILLGLTFMLLGALPILYHYFESDFFTNFAMENIIVSKRGVHNLNIFSNLLARFKHLNCVIGGSYYNYSNLGVLFSIIFFWSCVLYLSYLIFRVL